MLDFEYFRSKLDSIQMSQRDREYFLTILSQLNKAYQVALDARSKKLDPLDKPESLFAWDMAERVEKLVGPKGIADFIKEHESKMSRELLALKAVDAILNGEFGVFSLEKLAEQSLRTALAILTEGVTVAPTQGIYDVKIRRDPYPYLSIYFAGPIRSAGGTESGLILVYADYVRKRLGLMKWRPIISQTENEINRYIEEIRIYEREVGRFQYKVPDEVIEFVVSKLPVELNGVPTTEVEVTLNRSLSRVETNRLRGGALIVLNDGLIGRAKKIYSVVKELKIEGWEWLSEIDFKEAKGESNVIFDVIGGRPVISFPNDFSGFRLRYGRAPNTGLSAVGIHPAVFAILDYVLVPGTQIKVEFPGKGAIVVPVSSLSPPVVKLKDGSVVRVKSEEEAKKLRENVSRVLWLGDILISVGDFLENNAELKPSAYTEEFWIEDLRNVINNYFSNAKQIGIDEERLNSLLNGDLPTFEEALNISRFLKIPLHPRYALRWSLISVNDLIYLLKFLKENLTTTGRYIALPRDSRLERILDTILATYIIKDGLIIPLDESREILQYLSKVSKVPTDLSADSALSLISNVMGVNVADVTGYTVAARMGRPEKASRREMKPPVHVLFPVSVYGGPSRNLIQAAESKGKIEVDLSYRKCEKCGKTTYYVYCPSCGSNTAQLYYCDICNRTFTNSVCPECGRPTKPYKRVVIDLKSMINDCKAKFKQSPKIVKGVKGLASLTKVPEPLAKGFLRAVFDLSVFKDGTIRFDVTNAPLTHFRPIDIGLSLEKAKQLGYSVKSEYDLVPLKVQDVIIPKNAAEYFVRVANFIDRLLTDVYGLSPFYNIKTPEDLIGHLIVGLSPHTSVGVIGRIIGFTAAQVLYAHPFWHAAKRRDCDGDQDSIMLLMDILINFSRYYLPQTIGGEMDTPLLISPVIIPSEVDSQAHKMELVWSYPRIFYESCTRGKKMSEVADAFKWVYNYLNTEEQYSEIPYTFSDFLLSLEVNVTSYSRLKTMKDKILHQLFISMLVSPDFSHRIAKSVIEHHLLPDLLGNLRAFLTRGFKCRKCGAIFRRLPLSGRCERCGSELSPTVHEGSVIKYLSIVKDLLHRFCIKEPYLLQRVEIMERELNFLVMRGFRRDQRDLSDYL